MTDLDRDLGRAFQRILRKRNLTQQRAAYLVGWPQARVSFLCTGRQSWRMSDWLRACDYLNINPQEWLKEAGLEPRA